MYRYLLLLILLSTVSCAAIDPLCVYGQATPREADALNAIREQEHAEAIAKDPKDNYPYPTYCTQSVPKGQHGGDTDCEIGDRTRFINGACSGILKRFSR